MICIQRVPPALLAAEELTILAHCRMQILECGSSEGKVASLTASLLRQLTQLVFCISVYIEKLPDFLSERNVIVDFICLRKHHITDR